MSANNAPRPVYKRPYPNLDAIFGHVFSNLTGEPITPTRVATFYLLRILFQTHFGKRDVVSRYPFNTAEKNKIFQYLFSLMSTTEEIPYKTYRDVVRAIFGKDREIAYNFFACMEQIGQGHAEVNLAVEDEFYTNRHSKIAYGKPPPGSSEQYFYEINALKELPFSSSHSHMYRWLKRLLAQVAKMTPNEMFELNTVTRKWIMSSQNEICTPLGLPTFLDSSMKARKWVGDNIYTLQKSPCSSQSFDEVISTLKMIQQRHRDVLEAHLLEAVVHVHLKDPSSAVRCMKMFFDLSMLELTGNIGHALRTFRLTVPTQMPLLYAPIMQARVLRMFGDYVTARQLLQESLQQAQLRGDEITHQLAHLEMHTIDIIGMGPLLEQKEDDSPNHMEDDPRVQRKTLKTIDDLNTVVGPMGLPCCSLTEDDFELCTEMDSLSKMLMMLRTMARSTFMLQYDEPSETGLRLPTGHDLDERGKKIEGFGYAIMTSNLIRNGMYEQAKTAGSEMVVSNFVTKLDTPLPDGVFLTESWAVGTVNMAYSEAAMGNYEAALKVIAQGQEQFPEDKAWQCHRHLAIASTIINFEKNFLRNNYKICALLIEDLKAFSLVEYTLRKALLLAATTRDHEAIRLLHGLTTFDNRARIRVHMLLACIYTAIQMYEKTELELIEAEKIAQATTLKDIRAMIVRRRATMLTCRGNYTEALELLHKCYLDIVKYTSFAEQACYYITAARCLRLSNKDPRIWLKHARQVVAGKKWPTFDKLILSEIAAMHEADGLYPNPDRLSQVREQFGKITADFPGRCEWLLL